MKKHFLLATMLASFLLVAHPVKAQEEPANNRSLGIGNQYISMEFDFHGIVGSFYEGQGSGVGGGMGITLLGGARPGDSGILYGLNMGVDGLFVSANDNNQASNSVSLSDVISNTINGRIVVMAPIVGVLGYNLAFDWFVLSPRFEVGTALIFDNLTAFYPALRLGAATNIAFALSPHSSISLNVKYNYNGDGTVKQPFLENVGGVVTAVERDVKYPASHTGTFALAFNFSF